MANSGPGVRYTERCDSLSNTSRVKVRPPASVYSNLRANLRATPSIMQNLENRQNVAEEDEFLYTQVVGQSGLQKWPVPRSKSLQSLRTMAERQQFSENSTIITCSTRMHLRPEMRSALNKEIATPKRRKPSLPDLALGHMTTVQECSLDSPTIPGHHPILRSMTFPDTKLRHVPEEAVEGTSRGSLFLCCHLENSPKPETMAESSDKTVNRRSSMILLNHVEASATPPSTEPTKYSRACRITPSDAEGDKPPPVPPKSPRTESRAFRRPGKLSHSASSSLSTAYGTSSAETSVSSQAMHIPLCIESPSCNDACSNIIQKIPAETLKSLDQSGRYTPPQTESPKSRPHNPRNGEQDVSIFPQVGLKMGNQSGFQEPKKHLEGKNAAEHRERLNSIWHEKEIAEASIIDRGRPMRRGDTSLMCKISKATLKRPSHDQKDIEIPTGIRAREASNSLPGPDLKILKQLANERVECFEVLSMEDVSNLSRELVLLDERCQYLRHTSTSLRQSRRGLRERVISYLKSPAISEQRCGSILKQEEVLAELDLSIDDWLLKLEHAESRRFLIRQKLLEHVAAVLTIKTTTAVENGRQQQQQQRTIANVEETPPTTPEQTENDYSQEPCDIESIRVCTDTGVAALLSALEDEISRMEGI